MLRSRNTVLSEKPIKTAVFGDKVIRKIFYKSEWWFVVNDVAATQAKSRNVYEFVKMLKRKDIKLSKIWDKVTMRFPIDTSGGQQLMVCATVESLMRLLQSIEPERREAMHRWLTKEAKKPDPAAILDIKTPLKQMATKRIKRSGPA